MKVKSVGSICSGIEAASVAWKDYKFDFKWFSEIADFPSALLKNKYPHIPNLGDMNDIPEKLLNKKIHAPDLICGGTPCQAFSLAGWQNGLKDQRGNLTLKFVDIVNANDKIREQNGDEDCIIFWENVEGVLRDKTNAFGCFLASLSGCLKEFNFHKWPNAGLVRGIKRNIAWRVIDAKYFGLPQQRRRLYVLAGGKKFNPENILFEKHEKPFGKYKKVPLVFNKNGHLIEVFREYTDCLYSAYGTKWNGNAAAYNGSLFVVQDDRLRRLTPLECERLMGFPDNYTSLSIGKPTNRYQATGNSWAIPVVKWIGGRIIKENLESFQINDTQMGLLDRTFHFDDNTDFYDLGGESIIIDGYSINTSEIPENILPSNIKDIIDTEATENFYISPAGCAGILRRKDERNLKINKRLEEILISISAEWTKEKILERSLIQKRGKFSATIPDLCDRHSANN